MVEDASEPVPQSITPEMLNVYAQMLACLFGATLLLILVIAIPMLIADYRGIELPILPFVALSGAMGAFVSALSRLYALKELPALLLQQGFRGIENRYVIMYALVPPLVGIIGAIVVYAASLAGLIQGELFPKFACGHASENCASFVGLLHYAPVGATDYAKALVWGFVSGFSERLVPNALEQLAKTA